MIRCKQTIGSDTTCGKDICCYTCDDMKECREACFMFEDIDDFIVNGCEHSATEIQAFESQGTSIIQTITDITIQMEQLKNQEKKMREALVEAMEKYGVKKFENDKVTFTYKAPTTRTTVDSTKLKADGLYEKYSKTSDVSASVVIKIK